MSDQIFRSGKRRIFVSTPIAQGQACWILNELNAHYLSRVLRLKAGTKVDLADGSGCLYQGELTQEGNAWTLANLRLIHQEPPEPERILAAALIKPDRWEWMLEKAAEIGATRILPIAADRSVVSIPSNKLDKRLERWERIVEGAARQCERLSQVTIDVPTSLASALESTRNTTQLMLDEDVPKRTWPTLTPREAITLFIGPEGGWSDDERHLLHTTATPCGLGRNLLRAETAAISALTLVRAFDNKLLGIED